MSCSRLVGTTNGPVPIEREGSVPGIVRFADQALPMILNMPVLHSGQVPFIALRPLAITTSLGSFMLRFALHFTQYASTAAAMVV